MISLNFYDKIFIFLNKILNKLPCWMVGHDWYWKLDNNNIIHLNSNNIPYDAYCIKCKKYFCDI